MPSPPNIIVEIGERYCVDHKTGKSAPKLRAVAKFTYKTPPLPGVKNKDTRWYGPMGLKDDGITEEDKECVWGTAEAVKLLRLVADEIEAKEYQSFDKSKQGDMLEVMQYELSK